MIFILLFLLAILFWGTPIVMLIVGLASWGEKPQKSKQLIIGAVIWLVIGMGYCGLINV